MEGQIVNLWELSIAMCYHTGHGLRERSVSCLCTAEDAGEAILSAKRYSKWLFENWRYGEGESNCFIGAITVYPRNIGPVDDNGAPYEILGFPCFEWKADWPGNLDQCIVMRMRELVKEGL